jgi:hypothetical protein
MLSFAAVALVAGPVMADTVRSPTPISLEHSRDFTTHRLKSQAYGTIRTAGKPGSSRPTVPTRPGELIITEIMVDPYRVLDTAGEWFEICNATKGDLELQGVVIANDGTERFRINQSLVIPSGGFLVFGNNGDPKTNGGARIAFVYSGFTLNNMGGAIVIQSGATVIDSVRYDAKSFRVTAGRAINLNPNAFNATANDTGINWCPASQQMPGGDYGTPGFANTPC